MGSNPGAGKKNLPKYMHNNLFVEFFHDILVNWEIYNLTGLKMRPFLKKTHVMPENPILFC